jgi:hypothetical protein
MNDKSGELDEDALEFCKDFRKKYHVFGLEAYIHSGVSLALSREGNFPDRQWDVSQLGCVFAEIAEFGSGGVEFKNTREQSRLKALSLIKSWNYCLSGDVYGCVLETYDKNKKQIDQDSCWGFYGYEYAKEELKTFRG